MKRYAYKITGMLLAVAMAVCSFAFAAYADEGETDDTMYIGGPTDAAEALAEEEPLADSDEADYIANDGTITSCSFADAWKMAIENQRGTISLKKSIAIDPDTGFGSEPGVFQNGGLLVQVPAKLLIEMNNNTISYAPSSPKPSDCFLKITNADASITFRNGGLLQYSNPDGSVIFNNGHLRLQNSYMNSPGVKTGIHTTHHGVLQLTNAVLTNVAASEAAVCAGGLVQIDDNPNIQNRTNISNTIDQSHGLLLDTNSEDNGRLEISQSPTGMVRLHPDCGAKKIGTITDSASGLDIVPPDGYMVHNMGGTLVLVPNSGDEATYEYGGQTVTTDFASAWNLMASVGDGKVTLLKDVTAVTNPGDAASSFGTGVGIDGGHTLLVPENTNMTLDLDGHTLDRANLSNPSDNMSGETFRVKGTLEISGGTVKGGNGAETGAIHILPGGTVKLTQGCNVIENDSSNPDGASAVCNEGTLILDGATITDNKNGGVHNKGRIEMSNKAYIHGNELNGKEVNIKLTSNDLVVTSPLAEGSLVGVTSSNIIIGKYSETNDATYFVDDTGVNKVTASCGNLTFKELDPNAEAVWACDNDMDAGTFADMWALAKEKGGSVTIRKNVTTSGTFAADTHDIGLNLENHTVSGALFSTSGSAQLTVNGKTAPKATTSNVKTISTSNLLNELTSWRTNYKPAWNADTKSITYYTVEGSDKTLVKLVRNVADLSDVGALETSSDTPLFTASGSSSIVLNGVRVSNSGSQAVSLASKSSKLSATATWFLENKGANGGAITTTNGGSIELNNSYLIGNAATNGGAIYATGDTSTKSPVKLKIKNSVVSGNTTSGNAAAMHVSNSMDMTGSMIACNYSTGNYGGIYLLNSPSASISDTTVGGNYTSQRGGGLYQGNGARNLTLTNVKFMANRAQKGGGLYIEGSDTSPATVTDCLFKNNASTVDGGGMYNKTSPIKISKCVFAENTATTSRAGFVIFETNRTSSVTDTTIRDNQAGGTCGGAFLYKSDVNVTNCDIYNNIVTNKTTEMAGAGLFVDKDTSMTRSPNVTIENSRITGNSVTQNVGYGGGIYCGPGMNLTIKNSTISNNNAGQGSGVYVSDTAQLNLDGAVDIMNNTKSNIRLISKLPIKIVKALTQSHIGVTVNGTPTVADPIVVATTNTQWNDRFNFFDDTSQWVTRFVNDMIVFTTDEAEDVDFDGVIVQYYANLQTPVKYDAADTTSTSLELINMSQSGLPTNSKTPPINYLYIENENIKQEIKLTKIYQDKIFKLSHIIDIESMNRFTELDQKVGKLIELWVLKPGRKQASLNRDDWTIYPFSKDLGLEDLGIADGSVVRFVCDVAETQRTLDVDFFDYDITDGHYYTSYENMLSQTDPQPISTWDSKSKIWVNTVKQGINSDANVEGKTGTARYAFGNANHGTTLSNEMTSGTYKINMINRPSFKGCYYGLVTGLDENKQLIWNPEIKAPNLFDDGDAIGKTKLDGYSLEFKGIGQTFTLSKVNGAGDNAQELTKLHHPHYGTTIYDKIYTNDFWPLDDSESVMTDGHDTLEGLKEAAEKKWLRIPNEKNLSVNNDLAMPPSDDGQWHNGFFGMHFEINFQCVEDYVAPLNYYFFGDDDLWVFLDNKLICDIGGVHSSVGAYMDLRKYVPVGDTDKHTLSVYYTERGASGSTCWMQFTLPSTLTDKTHESSMFDKTDFEGNPIRGAVFGLYSDAECQNEVERFTSSLAGHVIMTGLEIQRTYYVKEIEPPPGYFIDPSTYALQKDENGEWVMYKQTDPARAAITVIPNEEMLEFSFMKNDEKGSPLPGATFTMYTDPDCKNGYDMATSDDEGRVSFYMLSKDDTYYVRETSAPDGYAPSDETYVLSATETTDADGNSVVTWTMSDSKGKAVTAVTNLPSSGGPEMPDTGGPGWAPYLLGLVPMGMGVLIIKRAIRKKRLT